MNLEQFKQSIEKKYSLPEFDDFASLENDFKKILNLNFVKDLLNTAMESFCESKSVGFRGLNKNRCAIVINDSITLYVHVFTKGQEHQELLSLPSQAMLGCIHLADHSALQIQHYRHEGHYENDVFQDDFTLTKHKDIILEGTTVKHIEAGIDVIALDKKEHTTIILTLTNKPSLSYVWEYDRETLKPLQLIAYDLVHFRLYYVATLLGSFGNLNSSEILLNLSHHKNHYVRWTAIQNLFKLNFVQGLERLHIAQNDSHKSIRNAAKNAIANLAG